MGSFVHHRRSVGSFVVAVMLCALCLNGLTLAAPQRAQAIFAVDDAVEETVFADAVEAWLADSTLFPAESSVAAAASEAGVSPAQFITARAVVSSILIAAIVSGQVAGLDLNNPDPQNKATQSYIAGLKRNDALGYLVSASGNAVRQNQNEWISTYDLLKHLYWSKPVIGGIPTDGLVAPGGQSGIGCSDGICTTQQANMIAFMYAHSHDSSAWQTYNYGPATKHYYTCYYTAPDNATITLVGWWWSAVYNGQTPGTWWMNNNASIFTSFLTAHNPNWSLPEWQGAEHSGYHDFTPDVHTQALPIPQTIWDKANNGGAGLSTATSALYPGEGTSSGAAPAGVGDTFTGPTPTPASGATELNWGPMLNWLAVPLNMIISLLQQLLAALNGLWNWVVSAITGLLQRIAGGVDSLVDWATHFWDNATAWAESLIVPTDAAQQAELSSDYTSVKTELEHVWPFAALPWLGSLPSLFSGSGSVNMVVDFDIWQSPQVHVHFDFTPWLNAYLLPWRALMAGVVYILGIVGIVRLLRPQVAL